MRVAVVGAGIAGLMCAWRLQVAGHRVVVLEKDRVGAGASGRALGMLRPFDTHVRGNVAKVQRGSVAAWGTLVEELACEAGEEVGAFYRVWEAGAQLRVPEVLRVLAEAITRRGGEVMEGVEVENVDTLRAECDAVVLAAGMGNAPWVEGLQGLAGQALRLKPEVEVGEFINDDGFYIVPDWDGTVLVGSHQHKRSLNWPEAAVTEGLRGRAEKLCPALAGAELVTAWVADRPTVTPLLPLARPVKEGIVAVTGLGRLGYCLAPAVAAAVEGLLPA